MPGQCLSVVTVLGLRSDGLFFQNSRNRTRIRPKEIRASQARVLRGQSCCAGAAGRTRRQGGGAAGRRAPAASFTSSDEAEHRPGGVH